MVDSNNKTIIVEDIIEAEEEMHHIEVEVVQVLKWEEEEFNNHNRIFQCQANSNKIDTLQIRCSSNKCHL